MDDNLDKILSYKVRNENVRFGHILGIRFLFADQHEIISLILSWLEKKEKPKRISFLDPLKLMQIRYSSKRAEFLNRNNQIFLMEGKGLLLVARFLSKKKQMGKEKNRARDDIPPVRISRIKLFMQLMDITNAKGHSIYFLSNMRKKNMNLMQRKLLRVFPQLRIVGNHCQNESPERKSLIKQALHKASPDLICFGNRFWRQEKWTYENWKYVSRGVAINLERSLSILYGSFASFRLIRRIDESGWSWCWRLILQPWRLDYWFYFFAFLVFLVWARFHKIQQ